MVYPRTKDDHPNFTPIVKQCACVNQICSPYSLARATEHSSGNEPPKTGVYRLHEVGRAGDTIQHNKEGTNPLRRRVPIRGTVLPRVRVGGNRVGHGSLVKNERENGVRWSPSRVHDSDLYNPTQFPSLTCQPGYLVSWRTPDHAGMVFTAPFPLHHFS